MLLEKRMAIFNEEIVKKDYLWMGSRSLSENADFLQYTKSRLFNRGKNWLKNGVYVYK
jgi:hypothetical protein